MECDGIGIIIKWLVRLRRCVKDVFSTFQEIVESSGSKVFLRTIKSEYTYDEAAAKVDEFNRLLSAQGVESGDTVGLYLDNCPEFIYAFFGAIRGGVRVACINTAMRGKAFDHLVRKAEIDVLLSTDPLLRELGEDFGNERPVLSITPDTTYTHISSGASTSPIQTNAGGQPIPVLLHTSGTTGLPKWCEISHRYLIELGEFIASGFEIAPSDTVFNPLPLYHINPLGYYLFGGLAARATLGMVERFSVSKFWDQVHALDATVVILHMAPKNMILEETTDAEAVGHNIRTMFPADSKFMRRFDIPKMMTGYGSTEAAGLTHVNKFTAEPADLPQGEKLSQIAGSSRKDVSIRIADEDGSPVPQGQRGEILVRPASPGVLFGGYFNSPSNTAEAFEGLWYHSGDLGYIDGNGSLHFTGRLKDSISHKGEFVNIDIVESEIESFDAVEQAILVGIPDDIVGDRIMAVATVNEEVDPSALVEAIEPELPSFMMPEYVRIVEELPRLEGTKKVNRKALRQQGTDGAWHRG